MFNDNESTSSPSVKEETTESAGVEESAEDILPVSIQTLKNQHQGENKKEQKDISSRNTLNDADATPSNENENKKFIPSHNLLVKTKKEEDDIVSCENVNENKHKNIEKSTSCDDSSSGAKSDGECDIDNDNDDLGDDIEGEMKVEGALDHIVAASASNVRERRKGGKNASEKKIDQHKSTIEPIGSTTGSSGTIDNSLPTNSTIKSNRKQLTKRSNMQQSKYLLPLNNDNNNNINNNTHKQIKHNLASLPSWMASKLAQKSQYTCSRWDHLKLGTEVGSVSLNEYLNVVQDLKQPSREHYYSVLNTSPTNKTTSSANSFTSGTGSANSQNSVHYNDRQSKLTPVQVLHIIDTLRPRTCEPPQKSILRNLVNVGKSHDTQESEISVNVNTDRDDDYIENDDDNIGDTDIENDELAGSDLEAYADADADHDLNEIDKVNDEQYSDPKVVLGVNISTGLTLSNCVTKKEASNQNTKITTIDDHNHSHSIPISPSKENHDEVLKASTPEEAQEESSSPPRQKRTKLNVPWQSLVKLYQHMCTQDSLENGKTPLQRRKTHYMEYTEVIDNLRSLENRAMELKLRTDAIKRKQQELGILTSDERMKKKRL